MTNKMRTAYTYIIAVGILNERERVVRDLIHKLNSLMIRCMVDAPLKNAAAMTVSRYFHTIGGDCIVNELYHTKSISNENSCR